jgi:hypothetical protein
MLVSGEGLRNRGYIPITVGGDDIVDLELLGDLLDTQMQSVSVKLLSSHRGIDGRGQAHQASSLVLARIAPTVALLALSRTIGGICGGAVSTDREKRRETRLTSRRAATALQLRQALGRCSGIVAAVIALAAETTTISERDVVRAGDSLVAPRHVCCRSKWMVLGCESGGGTVARQSFRLGRGACRFR